MSALLVQADARALPLRDGCVDCVVTSPPYFGLRDYGSAQWEGGDPSCAHGADPEVVERWARRASTITNQRHQASAEAARACRFACPRCGARRTDDQVGLEGSVEAYIGGLVVAMREVRRVLSPSGTVWVVIGDSYCSQRNASQGKTSLMGSRRNQTRLREAHAARPSAGPGAPGRVDRGAGVRRKSLVLVPQRLAVALAIDGWLVRAEIVWEKTTACPGSQKDRPTRSHETILMLSKSARHFYNYPAGRVRATSRGYSWATLRTVWRFPPAPWRGDHPATFPEALAARCIELGAPPPCAGRVPVVLDPFAGSGTVVAAATRLGRHGVGLDLNRQWLAGDARRRLARAETPLLVQGGAA